MIKWWENREEIERDGFPKAHKYSKEEIEDLHYNLDLCGFPHIEEEVLEPKVLIEQYRKQRDEYNAEMEEILGCILRLIDEEN